MPVSATDVRRFLPKIVSDQVQGNDLIDVLIEEKAGDVELRTGFNTQTALPTNGSPDPVPRRKVLEGIVRDRVVAALLRRAYATTSRDAAGAVDSWESAIDSRLNQYDAATTPPEGAEGGGLYGGEGGADDSEGGWVAYTNKLDVFQEEPDPSVGHRMLEGTE